MVAKLFHLGQVHRSFSLIAIALMHGVLSACTYTVDSFDDAPDADPGDLVCARAGPPRDGEGLCTLRAAIMEANARPFTQRIEVPSGTYSLTLPDAAGGGPLVVNANVAIRGAGAASTIVNAGSIVYGGSGECPDATGGRVFTVQGGAVTLSYLTIQGGAAQFGGGISVAGGTLELTDAVLKRNVAFTGGGGMLVQGGVVRVRRTSLIENCAVGAFGGAVLNDDAGELWVYDSLIANNRSNRTGGIYNEGLLNLRSTTVSGNIADSPEAGTGGLSQNNFAVLNNVTVTANVGIGDDPNSFLGGGIGTRAGATTVLKNSIVAGNDGQGGPNDCAGELTSDSRYNLIGDSAGCEFSGITTTYVLDVDARLAGLANNGGPTLSHAILSDSPAREAGFPFTPGSPAADACEAHDQRAVPRPQGSGVCDLGAYERDNLNVFVTGFVLVDADADEDIGAIRSGELLNLAQLPPSLSIRATVSAAPSSVVFALDGDAESQIENAEPYALGGDSPAGDFNPVTLTPGAHRIRATPYAAPGGTGAAGGSLELTLQVIGE